MFSENKEFYIWIFQIIEKLKQTISTIVSKDKNCSMSVDVQCQKFSLQTWESCKIAYDLNI